MDPMVLIRHQSARVRVHKHAVAFDEGDEQLFVRLAEQQLAALVELVAVTMRTVQIGWYIG